MSKSRTSTYRRFEERHPDLWDEVQAMIESDRSASSERAAAPSIFARFFRGGGSRGGVRGPRRERDEGS
jgi:hypothetical protein